MKKCTIYFQGKYCKCANEARFNLYKDDAGCDVQCPVIEHCGGDNRVSLYDTLRMLKKIRHYGKQYILSDFLVITTVVV